MPHARGIFDSAGRLMVLMTHNTDIGDSWEEEASNPQYFYEFSTKGYAFGINAIVYAMTHCPGTEPGTGSAFVIATRSVARGPHEQRIDVRRAIRSNCFCVGASDSSSSSS